MTRFSQKQYDDILKKTKGSSSDVAAPKKNKYNSKKTWVDGICFDSQKEANYYSELKLQQRAGNLLGFAMQCTFILSEGTDHNNRAITYVADFVVFYEDHTEIIDTKGMETDSFKLKKKMFKNKYPGLELKII